MISEYYLLAGVIIILIIFLWLIYRKLNGLVGNQQSQQTLMEWLKSMQSSVDNTNRVIFSSNKNMNDRLDTAARFIAQVAKEVGQVNELSKSMRDLQLFLQSPKIRGNIGEEVLKDLISQVFPKNSFYFQHEFRSGDKVDAAIKTAAGILPIDSKFPLDNFKRMVSAETREERQTAKKDFTRDVKRHITDISKKYILLEEGTLDFALMYLPSEAVFYEVANSEELTNFARKNRIYPVSPNTLHVHLQTILLSYEGQKIETRAKEVFRLLRALQKDYEKTESVLQVLGKHLNNAYNQFSHVLQSFNLMGQKLASNKTLDESEDKEDRLKSQN